jgi:hypothetical protein
VELVTFHFHHFVLGPQNMFTLGCELYNVDNLCCFLCTELMLFTTLMIKRRDLTLCLFAVELLLIFIDGLF